MYKTPYYLIAVDSFNLIDRNVYSEKKMQVPKLKQNFAFQVIYCVQMKIVFSVNNTVENSI